MRLEPFTLTGTHVQLEPLTHGHAEELLHAANRDRSTYGYTPVPADDAAMVAYIDWLRGDAERDTVVPFVQRRLADDTPVGCTRYLNVTWYAGRDTPAQVVFWQSVFGLACFAPAGLWYWQGPSAWQCTLFLLAGIFGTAGYFFMTWAFRLLDISALQPLAFIGIVGPTLFDLVVFGKTSDAFTFVGAGIIVAATSWIAHRESRALNAARQAPPRATD